VKCPNLEGDHTSTRENGDEAQIYRKTKRKMNNTTQDSKPIFHCNLAKFATTTEVTALPHSFDWN
jgi:hypothetical protein